MKTIIAGTMTALMSVSFAAAAVAQNASTQTATAEVTAAQTATAAKADAKVEIAERDAKGRVTKVRIGADLIPVCMNETMTDGCINPWEAGLKWGNRPVATYTAKVDVE